MGYVHTCHYANLSRPCLCKQSNVTFAFLFKGTEQLYKECITITTCRTFMTPRIAVIYSCNIHRIQIHILYGHMLCNLFWAVTKNQSKVLYSRESRVKNNSWNILPKKNLDRLHICFHVHELVEALAPFINDYYNDYHFFYIFFLQKNREGVDLCSTCKTAMTTIDSMLSNAAIQV